MDDITFRRIIYTDPFTTDKEVVEAAKNDPKKQAFWEEIRAMESAMQEAMDIPVPEDLADKLILRQSMNDFKQKKKQRPWYLALAASVVFASVLTIGLIGSSSQGLASDVFAHMSHMEYEINKYGPTDLASVNSKLATYNGQIKEGFGEIVSANYCYLDSIKSLHLIIKGEKGLTSLFVVPSQLAEPLDESFSNDVYTGSAFLLESAKVIVVSEDPSQVSAITQKAKEFLSFSI
ncbi:DUF3379 family protein [Glaciecola sp. XM2]|jgi:hypothetical protein|uniref:DUF3379 family protein n=1 Tax=Glaciecola sp. XM2 TaxID=1914931 RepID=UPI001BDF4A80|nr:DUF3379 family protein [Glaciecola sp. XM2]MBT1449907.1 DUF3379 family protein [Glaciecola sp. XM2]